MRFFNKIHLAIGEQVGGRDLSRRAVYRSDVPAVRFKLKCIKWQLIRARRPLSVLFSFTFILQSNRFAFRLKCFSSLVAHFRLN